MNAFLDLAERQIRAPVKARQRAAERRAEINKPSQESAQLKEWRQWRDGQLNDALAGASGLAIAGLIGHLRSVTHWAEIDSGGILATWRSADSDTQFIVRRLISDRIAELREAAGLPPFDDPLPF
jgi:hypothetical protein